MSKFDGSPDELGYGHALLELADRVSWPSEAHCNEVKAAIRAEHGIVLPDPDRPYVHDPRDAELDELRRKVAAQDAKAAADAKDAELTALRAKLAADAEKDAEINERASITTDA